MARGISRAGTLLRLPFDRRPMKFRCAGSTRRCFRGRAATKLGFGVKSALTPGFPLTLAQTLFPEAVFVHIVRHPGAATLSRFRKAFHDESLLPPGRTSLRDPDWRRSVRYFAQSAERWKRSITEVRTIANALSLRWIEIRYEDFLLAPAETIKAVLDAVGLPFEPEMLARTGARAMKDASRRGSVESPSSGPGLRPLTDR